VTHPVVEGLASPDPDVRVQACRDAVDDPSAVLLLEALAGALGDPVKAVGRAAGDALATLGRRVDGVEPVIREALRGDSPAQRWNAAFTSARLAPPSPALLPPLVDALASPAGDVRWSAARLLVDTGRLHGEVLPLLLGLARSDERPVVRRMAAHCLRQLAPDRPEAAYVLLEGSRDDDVQVRRASLAAMVALIDPPPELFPRLLEVLTGDDDPPSRRIASVALAELGANDPRMLPSQTLPVLQQTAQSSDDPDLRRGAQRALARIEASERA